MDLFQQLTKALGRTVRLRYLLVWIIVSLGGVLAWQAQGALLVIGVAGLAGILLFYFHAISLHVAEQESLQEARRQAEITEQLNHVLSVVIEGRAKLSEQVTRQYDLAQAQGETMQREALRMATMMRESDSVMLELIKREALALSQSMQAVVETLRGEINRTAVNTQQSAIASHSNILEQVGVMLQASAAKLSDQVAASSRESREVLTKAVSAQTEVVGGHLKAQLAPLIDRSLAMTSSLEKLALGMESGGANQLTYLKRLIDEVQALATQNAHARMLWQAAQQSVRVGVAGEDECEVIEDKANGLTLKNKYQGGVIRQSELFENGRLKYSAEYDDSASLTHTKNYDNQGKLCTELAYYADGQIRERIEWVEKLGQPSKVVTKYDRQGQKQS